MVASTEFVLRHTAIDERVWIERKKIARIKKRFLLLDYTVFVALVGGNYLCFLTDLNSSQLIIVPFLVLANTMLFALFACRLGCKIRYWTGAKPNMKLVYIHIFNTVIQFIVSTVTVIMWFKLQDSID